MARTKIDVPLAARSNYTSVIVSYSNGIDSTGALYWAMQNFAPEMIYQAVCAIAELGRVHIKGLMAIPPVCDNELQNRKYFEQMYKLFVDIRGKKIDNSSMDILSMGMSDDYAAAIREGANLVRIGTALFGRRNYNI